MLSGNFDLLAEGLERLCRADSATDALITPRRAAMYILLVQYIQEIEHYNPALSLVGTNNRHELIVRHILDSLAPLSIIHRQLAAGRTIADVGSGAGLPGIPLAIALPEVEFTLIERMGKRSKFLRHIKKELGLANVAVEEEEMEKEKPGRFALVTFRAFAPLEPVVYKKLSRLCVNGGTLAAFKGRREKIDAEVATLGTVCQITPYPVPFLNEERHIVSLPQQSK